jgi:hypothetical protein
MKFVNDFNTFLRLNVNLDKSRIETLESRVASIESFLAAHETFNECFLDVIPTGSWAHRTIIRPVRSNDEYDADILLHLEEMPDWNPKDYIDRLYSAFASSGTYDSKAKKMTRCVRIDYAGDVHVDVVPYLARLGSHVIANRKEPVPTGRFEASNPEAFAAWVDERQRLTRGHFIKVVRLVKFLRDHKDTFSCKSIILTTLLGNLIQPYEETEATTLYSDVPTSLTTLMTRLADSLPASMPAIYDPAGTGDNFSERYRDDWNYDNFRAQMRYYAEKIDRAYRTVDATESTLLWREVFGDQFRASDEASASAITKSTLSAAVRASGEQFIHESPFSMVVALKPGATLRITARCTGLKTGAYYRRKGFQQYDLARRGNRVKKNRSLKFTATTNVPGATLYWKVRNGGAEAASVSGGLRGEIRQDAGGGHNIESTSYRGTHYVECYAVVDGTVVAMDHQTVIVED